MMKKIIFLSSIIVLQFTCNKNDDEDNEVLCQNDNSTDQNSHQCTTTPTVSSTYSESINGDNRVISTNGIPSHDYRNQIPNIVDEKVPEFIQHRHSQSVLSLIVKKAGSTLLSAYESEWALNDKGIRTYNHLNNFPIIAKRDKQKNLIGRFIDRQVKNIKRKASQIKSIFKN